MAILYSDFRIVYRCTQEINTTYHSVPKEKNRWKIVGIIAIALLSLLTTLCLTAAIRVQLCRSKAEEVSVILSLQQNPGVSGANEGQVSWRKRRWPPESWSSTVVEKRRILIGRLTDQKTWKQFCNSFHFRMRSCKITQELVILTRYDNCQTGEKQFYPC